MTVTDGNLPGDVSGVKAAGGYSPNVGVIPLLLGAPTIDGQLQPAGPLVVQQVAGQEITATLLAAGSTGTANGDFTVTGMATAVLTILPTSYTGTITFKASADGTNFDIIQGNQQGTSTLATSVASPSNTKSIWTFQVAGLQTLRAAISGGSGSVSVVGAASPEPNSAPLATTITSTVLGGGTAVVGSVLLQSVSGTALGADASNTELKVSAYGKSSAAGDTPIKVASSGDVIVEGAGTAGTATGGVVTVQGVASMTPVLGKVVDAAGTNQAGVDAYHNIQVTDGGTATVVITASSAGAVKAAAGRLCRVLTTSTATAAVNIYDNTNAASGTIIATIPAATTVGTIYSPQMPAAVGIYVGGVAGSPGLTVSYS